MANTIHLKDNRRAPRRPMRYTAWITVDGKEMHGCALADISDTGARIDIEGAEKMPEQFFLLLSRRHNAATPRRICRVVWRKPGQLGVTFERRFVPTEAPASA